MEIWPLLAYWIIYLLFAIPAAFVPPRYLSGSHQVNFGRINGNWIPILVGLTLVIGFRNEVGGDWFNYFSYINFATDMSYSEALRQEEPGYWIINVFAANFGYGIVAVNTISAGIFTLGLVSFCRRLPRPILALAVAIPYLVIVVAMGYTRQSAAIGFALLGLVALGRNKFYWFIFWTVLAATFHKSAVLLIPIAALTATKSKWMAIFVATLATIIAYKVLLENEVEGLVENYIEASYQSSGAFIRLAMNALPAALFLVYQKRFRISPASMKLWKLFSWLSLALFVAFFLTSASTALDRLALYMIPLQLVVFSHLPDVLGKYGKQNQIIVLAILFFYSTVLFVWLNFATNSFAWLPFKMSF